MSFALEIKNLSYTYPDGTPALQKINLQVEKSKKVAILGINGSGKTTLIHHLNGSILAQTGEVKVMDCQVTSTNLRKIRRLVGLLFDNPDNQLFSTTVYADIAFGPRNLKLSPKMVSEKVMTAMQKVGVTELANRPPYCLSWGQKKRAAIAGILAMEPQLLSCDEPFSGLDPLVVMQFKQLLDHLKEQGATLIYSTHDVNLAYDWADQVVIMKGGQIIESGPVDVLSEAQLMHSAGLPLPVLAELFKHSQFKPRTVEEAAELLSQNLGISK